MGIERIGSFQKAFEAAPKTDPKKTAVNDKSVLKGNVQRSSTGVYTETELKELLHSITELPLASLEKLHTVQPGKASSLLK
jgi:hypothetical protein